MDDSHTRRTKPCWFRTNNLGVKAFNDSILLESVLYQLVSSYCRKQPYYLDILELLHDVRFPLKTTKSSSISNELEILMNYFLQVTLQTSLGQAMDLLSAPNANEKPNIEEFSMKKYNAIVKYKTAFYSFFLPVALAMHMVIIAFIYSYYYFILISFLYLLLLILLICLCSAIDVCFGNCLKAGYNDKATLKKAENILLPMGQFFQVQDDFLDCFGDPEVTGKIGTDIEDGKCSWLVVTALSICSPTQRQLIQVLYCSSIHYY